MNSSGIKRGLAATAVSALAIAGVPLLASSASAAPGDAFTVTYTGPVLNGGTQGGVVVLRALDGTIDETVLELASTGSPTAGTEDTADQDVTIVDRAVSDDPSNSNYDLIKLNIAVTTPAAGQTATYRIFEDEDTDGVLDAGEARQNSSQTTSGPLASIDVTPSSQSAAQNIASAPYAVTLKDAAGRTTQLDSGEEIVLTDDADTTTNESGSSISADEIERGTDTFTATASTTGPHQIDLDSTTVPVVSATATLNVTTAATITAPEVDIVTAADSWNGFGDGSNGGTTFVRVDQNTIRIDFKSNDDNATVTLNVDGLGDVTFGGKDTTTVSTVLDSNGDGSVTITADAGSIQDGDMVDISGSFNQTLEFERTAADHVESADRYFSAVDGSVDVTATIVDQFGDPVTTGFIEAYRTGPNAAADATPQRKAVGADGTATFTFTDTKANSGDVENVQFDYYPDGFANSPTANGSTEIKYTADGMGSNYKTSLDGKDTEAGTYQPSDVTVVPLADTVADNDGGNESADLTIANGENGSDVTVTVDNDALILEPLETKLSQGSASITDSIAGGVLPAGYRIVGTKSGVVTVTIASANRTETAQFVVGAETDTTTARNVTVSGPAEVESGTTQITYTAVVTDAFGNPVVGLPANQLNVQVTGPAQFQDGDAVSNAAGQVNLNVRVDSGAEGDVAIRVQGLGSQFGAAADRLTSASATKDGEGLPVSSDVATATTTVKGEVVSAGIGLRLDGHGNGAADDKVTANAKNNAAGLTAVLYRGGKEIASHKLNRTGNYQFLVGDVNGKKATKYVVKVAATDTTQAGKAKKSVK